MLLDKVASYWDTRAEGYSQTILEELKGETGEKFREYLRRAMSDMEVHDCLDAGCGPGFFTLILSLDGLSVTSVDYSEDMLRRVRENCKAVNIQANTVRADVQKLPFEDVPGKSHGRRSLVGWRPWGR